MQKLSEIIGKKVLSLFEATEHGTIINARFSANLKRVKYYELFAENDENENSLFFPPSSVFAVSDTVMLKNGASVTSRLNLANGTVACPVNFSVYNPYGKYLGTVSDFELDGDKVVNIFVGNAVYSPSLVVRRGERILIINDTQNRIPLVSPTPKTKRSAPVAVEEESATVETPAGEVSQASVSVMPSVPVEQVETAPTTRESVFIPVRLRNDDASKAGGYSFLLGKKVTADISDGGEILAKEGEIITREHIEKANSTGKLVLLALYSS